MILKGFFPSLYILFIFKCILLIMLLQFSHFFPFIPPLPCSPQPPGFTSPLSSCPWDVHISSLSSLFPIPFLTSPRLFYAYQLCFFFPVPSPPFLLFLFYLFLLLLFQFWLLPQYFFNQNNTCLVLENKCNLKVITTIS